MEVLAGRLSIVKGGLTSDPNPGVPKRVTESLTTQNCYSCGALRIGGFKREDSRSDRRFLIKGSNQGSPREPNYLTTLI